jgi:hypothetical protein
MSPIVYLISAGVILVLSLGLFVVRFPRGAAPTPPPVQRRGGRGCIIASLLIICAIAGTLLWPVLSSSMSTALASAPLDLLHSQTTSPLSSESVVGDADISAAFINGVLIGAGSPAQGVGQEMYRDGVQFHIRPSFALAIFHMESGYGRMGVAVANHSIGNVRNDNGTGYRFYATWADSVKDFYQRIKAYYVDRGATTVSAIIPIYAPASDNNHPNQYIQSVRTDMAAWQKQG